MSQKIIADCPFCEDGCCFCDHSGKIYIGVGYFFESLAQFDDFLQGLLSIKTDD